LLDQRFLRLEQRAWLKDLSICANAKCVHTSYLGRISDLDILMSKDGNTQIKTGSSEQDGKLTQNYGAGSSVRKEMFADKYQTFSKNVRNMYVTNPKIQNIIGTKSP
jgi:hypothetical protein